MIPFESDLALSFLKEPFLPKGSALEVGGHKGLKYTAAEINYFGRGAHQIVRTELAEAPRKFYKHKPRTEAEKHLSETIAGFTTVVDKSARGVGMRMKIGLDRKGNISFNLIDRHGYCFLHLDQYEEDSLLSLMLLQTGFLTGFKKRGVHNINIGKIEHENRTHLGKFYCPKRYSVTAEEILYKYKSIRARRLALIKKKFRLNGWIAKHNESTGT